MAREGDAGGDDRADFGAVLAGLVAPPPAAKVPSPDGEAALSASALPEQGDLVGSERPVESLPLASTRAPLPLPPVPAPVEGSVPAPARSAEVVADEGELATPAAPAEVAVAVEPVDALLRDDGTDAPPQLSSSAASVAAEVVAAEIIRRVAQYVGGGLLPDPVAGEPVRANTSGAPAVMAAMQAGADQPPPRRSVAEVGRIGAGLADPLAGLRELVRGPSGRVERSLTDHGELMADGRTEAAASGDAPMRSSPRPGAAVVASEAAPRVAPVGRGLEDGVNAAVAPSGGTGEGTVTEAVVPASGRDAGGDASAAALGEGMSLSSTEPTPLPVTAAPAASGGPREAGAAVARQAPSTPPPPAFEPPSAPPVPTSHATLDLALGDGTTGRLRVAVRGDVVHATILAEGAAAVMLERELPALRRSLADRGFPDAQLTVRAAGGETVVLPPPPTSGAAPDRPATGRDRDEGAPRQPPPDRQDPTEDRRSRERRRPPQPEEYP